MNNSLWLWLILTVVALASLPAFAGKNPVPNTTVASATQAQLQTVKVSNMVCKSCVKSVTQMLKQTLGIDSQHVQVDLKTQTASFLLKEGYPLASVIDSFNRLSPDFKLSE
jgi:copper chaperone CopZ